MFGRTELPATMRIQTIFRRLQLPSFDPSAPLRLASLAQGRSGSNPEPAEAFDTSLYKSSALAQDRCFSSPSTPARLEELVRSDGRSLRSLARDRSAQAIPLKKSGTPACRFEISKWRAGTKRAKKGSRLLPRLAPMILIGAFRVGALFWGLHILRCITRRKRRG